MAEALQLAQRGSGAVEPNPRVGALLLQDGAIVGRGFHEHYGGPPPEIVALPQARAAGARPGTPGRAAEARSAAAPGGGPEEPRRAPGPCPTPASGPCSSARSIPTRATAAAGSSSWSSTASRCTTSCSPTKRSR